MNNFMPKKYLKQFVSFLVLLFSLVAYQNCGEGLKSITHGLSISSISQGSARAERIQVVSGSLNANSKVTVEVLTENTNSNTMYFWDLSCNGGQGDRANVFSMSKVFEFTCPLKGVARVNVRVENSPEDFATSSFTVMFEGPKSEDPPNENPDPILPIASLEGEISNLMGQENVVKVNFSKTGDVESYYWYLSCPGIAKSGKLSSNRNMISVACDNAGVAQVFLHADIQNGPSNFEVARASFNIVQPNIGINFPASIIMGTRVGASAVVDSSYRDVAVEWFLTCPGRAEISVENMYSNSAHRANISCPAQGGGGHLKAVLVYEGASYQAVKEVGFSVQDKPDDGNDPPPTISIQLAHSVYLKNQSLEAKYTVSDGSSINPNWSYQCPGKAVVQAGSSENLNIPGCDGVGTASIYLKVSNVLVASKSFSVQAATGLSVALSSTQVKEGQNITASISGHNGYHNVSYLWKKYCNSSEGWVALGKSSSQIFSCDKATTTAAIAFLLTDDQDQSIVFNEVSRSVMFTGEPAIRPVVKSIIVAASIKTGEAAVATAVVTGDPSDIVWSKSGTASCSVLRRASDPVKADVNCDTDGTLVLTAKIGSSVASSAVITVMKASTRPTPVEPKVIGIISPATVNIYEDFMVEANVEGDPSGLKWNSSNYSCSLKAGSSITKAVLNCPGGLATNLTASLPNGSSFTKTIKFTIVHSVKSVVAPSVVQVGKNFTVTAAVTGNPAFLNWSISGTANCKIASAQLSRTPVVNCSSGGNARFTARVMNETQGGAVSNQTTVEAPAGKPVSNLSISGPSYELESNRPFNLSIVATGDFEMSDVVWSSPYCSFSKTTKTRATAMCEVASRKPLRITINVTVKGVKASKSFIFSGGLILR